MPQPLNRLGMGSLMGCASACVLILGLMVARQSKSNGHILPLSDWAGEYLWVIAPFAALSIAVAVAWSSRFFSRWVLACVVFATVANPAVYFLVYLLLGGHEDASNTWNLFIGPAMTWNALGAFLVVAVIARVVKKVRQPSN